MAGDYYGLYYRASNPYWTYDSLCPKCGKPYIYVGDPIEGFGPKPWCECGKQPATPPTPFAQGWECPKCGRVHAPWVSTCPCWLENIKVTLSNSTNATVTFPDGVQFTPTTGGHVYKDKE